MTDASGLLASTLTAAAALAGVLALLVLALRGARAAGIGARAGRRLAVTEALALDGRRRLLLLRCDGRDLLLLTGGAQDQVLAWLPPTPGLTAPAPNEPAAPAPPRAAAPAPTRPAAPMPTVPAAPAPTRPGSPAP